MVRIVRTLAVGIACSTCACGYYDSSLLAASGSGKDASVDSAANDADSGQLCNSARPPAPPDVKGAGGKIEFVVGVQSVDFREGADYKMLGFDLDRTCTCQGDSLSCVPQSGVKVDDQCDGPDGRDNAGSALIAASAMLGLSSNDFNKDMKNGEWTLLLRVRGYNGQPDDDQVTVAWLVPDNLGKAPLFDGTDAWPIKKSCLNVDVNGQGDLERPLIEDRNAYVTKGRLVASLKGGASLDVQSQFSIVVNGAYIVATLVETTNGYKIDDGVLTGLWLSGDLLSQVPGGVVAGQPLCMNHPLYSGIKKQVCQARDLSSKGSMPSEPCDAISMAFSFVAKPAMIGAVVASNLPTSPCEPQFDPANDKCD